ncbi:sugar phosphate nucleotidyltransferase [Paenibacillus beijingensis]|uniref:Mannose-1-phosphate guanylyltransferase n=1 Tax=Paenibacillus beijingensis TaxID=1126833 RepID=A0A0D5NKE9_9BACL|nr:sugar phosphate nucleotidyltransferase [Paenibacillus beijingensis]AJY75716.1 mannose-1-phosphate guanylyltransferase [Paenibacillus beijingensis]
MRIVLLSGGSGKRLWPLSNESRSKQFLKVLKSDDGPLESMVQRVWGQIGKAGLGNHAYIATSKSQVEMIYSQLGVNLEVIVEPERRDTFPAIALAATYLYSVAGAGLNESVVVMPVDPYVDDSFFHKVKELDEVLDRSGADLALMGVKPTYPSEKYGYIVPGALGEAEGESYLKVESFREKPREEEAAEMIRHHALWNCGVFAFRLDLMINMLIAEGFPIQYEEMARQYAKLPKNSFDYEVVEKANHIVALPYEGSWKDLGTWNTLTEEIETPLIGKGILTDDSLNTHVINELEIPVTLLNVSNVIVAASPDGILVSDKASSPLIKDVMKHSEQRPMYEERRWGRYRVLDFLKYPDGNEVLTKRICVEAGKNLSYQYHMRRDEVWTVISGTGELLLDGKLLPLAAGNVFRIPKGSLHSLHAQTEIEIIEVQTGTELIEEDIVRLALDWNEIRTFINA